IAANNELDSRILALEAGDTVKNSTELEALKAEMTANESRIEGIRLDREFTIVKISLF
ncbi:MAG: hypothetical protein HGA22_05385, partial [Clostridiales bacterium]|nr:hypothetical protein [Clostridiales bacterium]